MLYVWTKNYPQVVGTCSGHHGQLISQNCVLTKIRADKFTSDHKRFSKSLIVQPLISAYYLSCIITAYTIMSDSLNSGFHIF